MKNVECNACGCNQTTTLFTAKDYISSEIFSVVKCKECGLVHINPRPSSDQIKSYYPELYYGEEPFLYEKMDASGRFRQVRKLVKAGNRVLDVGCGRGLVLKRLEELGCKVWGTELSAHSSKYAREILHLNILQKNLNDAAFESEFFDIVTLYHSLEHMFDPRGQLAEVYRILKPGGMALIEVPRFNSFYSRIFKDKWFHLDVPRHLYHFEDQTLSRLVKDAGFTIESAKRYAVMYDSFGGLQSLLNVVCSEMNLLNDMNTKRVSAGELFKKGNGRKKADVIISMGGQAILYFPFVLLAYGLIPFNIGGTLRVLCRK